MPHSTHGTIALMGSGEMAPAMVEAHKYVMSRAEGPVQAVFIDTPAGFELNADLIAARAVEYFQSSLTTDLTVVSYKSAAEASAADVRAAVSTLRSATYIFAGPGSPTYAIRHWKHTPVFDAIFESVSHGGCLTFASAASIVLGRFALPVYEIYKVGQPPHWVDGLNLLGHYGLDVCVIPHWNNTSGGNHDTRYCFVGLPRLLILEEMLPATTALLGIDEATACIMLLDQDICQVRGAGGVTIRRQGAEQVFEAGEQFEMALLRPPSPPDDRDAPKPPPAQPAPTWEDIRATHEALIAAPQPDSVALRAYIYDVLTLMGTAREGHDWQTVRQAEETLREALGNLLGAIDAPKVDRSELAAPFVELLLAVRQRLREGKQWALADQMRDGLADLGVVVEDGQDESTWRWGD